MLYRYWKYSFKKNYFQNVQIMLYIYILVKWIVLMFKKFYILPSVLGDYRSKLGEEYILSAFPFETDKYRAMQILQTVSACHESVTTFKKKILQLCVFTLN